MKHLKTFSEINEAKKEPSKKWGMTDANRRNIVRKAKKLIKEKEKGFNKLSTGKQETMQDDYIDKVCKEMGYKTSLFYATDGKKLNDLLGFDLHETDF